MFVNETKADLEFSLKVSDNMAGKKNLVLLGIASLITAIAGAGTLVLELCFPSEEGSDLFFPILCLVLALFCASLAVFYKPIMKLVLKKLSQGKETTNRFTFNEDGYFVETVMTDGTTSTAQGSYETFTAAKEYKDMWLLYINKATVFSVAKDSMIEGTAEDLTAFFARTFGSRYKVCYKNK